MRSYSGMLFSYCAGEESPLIVKTLLGLASTLTDMDDTIRAIGAYKRVLLLIEKDKGPTDESLALPLSHLGHCLLEEGRMDEAELALLRYEILRTFLTCLTATSHLIQIQGIERVLWNVVEC